MTPEVTAIILAGGRASRFGSDKLAVEIDGATVLDRAITAVSGLADDVVVVGSAETTLAVRGIDDPEPFGGPLQALAGGLAAAGSSVAIVVAGDMPALVPSVLALLITDLASKQDVDAVVLADPRDPGRRQPLPLAVRVEPARTAAAAALTAGDRSLVRLLGRLRVAEVASDRWLAVDPEARTLVDIDLPEDLRRARDVARDQRNR
ncbi:MAG TPA: molybdenum cofactor guanylyltransferase [Candidatus Limnocylindrales bacterium]|nr:molybdenum cofactor guanylyltransferase [Candidatus Limnocylindrales bacterium]